MVPSGGLTQARSPTLASVHCLLDLERPALQNTAELLDRLGINWSRPDSGVAEKDTPGLTVRVTTHGAGSGVGRAGLLLRCDSDSSTGQGLLLRQPVLPSTLEQGLLRLLLDSRYGPFTPGDMPG